MIDYYTFNFEYDYDKKLSTREKLLSNAKNIIEIEQKLKGVDELKAELMRLKAEEKELIQKLYTEEV